MLKKALSRLHASWSAAQKDRSHAKLSLGSMHYNSKVQAENLRYSNIAIT